MTFLNNRKEVSLPVRRAERAMGLTPFRSSFDDLVNDFFTETALNTWPALSESRGQLVPQIDVIENEKEYIVQAELPAMDEKNIDVSIDNNVLTLSGEKTENKEERDSNHYYAERRFGSFHRMIPFTCEVDENNVSAKYKNGLLKIKVAKTAEGMKSKKKIEIKSN